MHGGRMGSDRYDSATGSCGRATEQSLEHVQAVSHPTYKWLTRVALFLLGTTVLAACGPYPENTFAPASDNAERIRDLFLFIIVAAAVVYVIVVGLLMYTLSRFRGRAGDPRPSPLHGNTTVEIIWTVVPVIVLILIAIPTVQTIFIEQGDAPQGAVQIKAIGHMWWYEFQYTDEKFVTANEAHVPLGRAVNFSITSADVIHAFWLPRLQGKRDMIPLKTSSIWFTPTEAGLVEYGECTQLCGPSHAKMAFNVVVDSPTDFDAWLKQQKSPSAGSTSAADIERGAQLFTQSGCAGCHTIEGTESKGQIGPNLTHVGSRRMIAAAQLPNTVESLQAWIKNPAGFKPGEGQYPNTMPASALPDQDLAAIAAYLHALK